MRGLHTQWIESRYLLLNASDGVLFIGHDEVVVFIKHFHILEIQLAHLGDVLGLGGLLGGEFLGLFAIGLRLGSAGRLPFMFGLLDLEGAFAVVLADQVLFVAGDGAEHGGDLADAILGGPVIAHELEDEDLVEVHEECEIGRVIGLNPILDGFGLWPGSGEPFGREVVRGGSGSGLGGRTIYIIHGFDGVGFIHVLLWPMMVDWPGAKMAWCAFECFSCEDAQRSFIRRWKRMDADGERKVRVT